MNRCKRCLETKRDVARRTIVMAVEDYHSEDDGVIDGSVELNLCTKCALVIADKVRNVVRQNTQSGDLASGVRTEY